MRLNNEVSKPTLQPAAESAPHANVKIYNSTYEGAELISEFMDDQSIDKARSLAREQRGEETPLRSTSRYLLPTNPWPKTEEVFSKKNAFAFTR